MPSPWTPYTDADVVKVDVYDLETRTLELRGCFVGAAPPAVPVDGQIWVDSSAIPWRVKQYLQIDGGGSAWQFVGPLVRLPASINADPSPVDDRMAPWEHKALRIENRAVQPPAAPTNAGLLEYRTTNGEVEVSDQPVSGGWKWLLSVVQGGAGSLDTVELPLEGDLGNDAVNPPTKQRKGALEGWLFDAVLERRTLALIVPRNWQGATDLRLRLFQVLGQAQLAGDDIDWSGEVRTLAPGQAKVTKPATALAGASTDIGGVVEAIDDGGGPHVTELAIDHDDPANPVSAGCLVLVTVWRSTVGGAGKCGGTVLFRADLAYAQGPRHERA